MTYIIIVAITPGPNNIMSMNNAAQKGFMKSLPFNFGIFTGFILVLILCTVFSSLLFALIPRIQLPMQILGAAYMLYLAVKPFLPSKSREVKKSGGSFVIGMMLQFINPKFYIYAITAISSFVLPWFTEIPILAFFIFLLAFVGFACTICWSFFGSLFTKIFNKHGRIINVVMALLLIYTAASLFL
ncbi:MAG: LysE family transporter [Treponema sp.]|nr:LysE family transporter [Treponema sp.]